MLYSVLCLLYVDFFCVPHAVFCEFCDERLWMIFLTEGLKGDRIPCYELEFTSSGFETYSVPYHLFFAPFYFPESTM